VLESVGNVPVFAAGELTDADADDIAWACGQGAKGRRPGELDIVAKDTSGFEVKRYDINYPRTSHNGALVDGMCLYAGMGCSKIHDLPNAAELVYHLWRDSQH